VDPATGLFTRLKKNLKVFPPIRCEDYLLKNTRGAKRFISTKAFNLYKDFGTCFDISKGLTIDGAVGENIQQVEKSANWT
jgi:hypothetical protein